MEPKFFFYKKVLKLIIITSILFSILPVFLYSQQVKKIIGWVKRPDDKDYSPLIEKTYSEEGYLLSECDQRIYLDDEYTYDSLGRRTSFTHYCGENSGNGTTEYFYLDNKVIISEVVSGWDREIREEYNTQGKIIKSNEIFSDRYYHKFESTTIFSYDSEGRKISSHKVTTDFTLDGGKETSSTENITLSIYTYDKLKRLTGIIEIDLESGFIDNRMLFVYVNDTDCLYCEKCYHSEYYDGKTEVLAYGYTYTYEYDAGGRIKKEPYYRDPEGKDPQYEICYLYNDSGQIWQKNITHYWKNQKSYTEQEIYKAGILVRTKKIDTQNNLIEIIDFQYLYW
jgi:hypothetical protein